MASTKLFSNMSTEMIKETDDFRSFILKDNSGNVVSSETIFHNFHQFDLILREILIASSPVHISFTQPIDRFQWKEVKTSSSQNLNSMEVANHSETNFVLSINDKPLYKVWTDHSLWTELKTEKFPFTGISQLFVFLFCLIKGFNSLKQNGCIHKALHHGNLLFNERNQKDIKSSNSDQDIGFDTALLANFSETRVYSLVWQYENQNLYRNFLIGDDWAKYICIPLLELMEKNIRLLFLQPFVKILLAVLSYFPKESVYMSQVRSRIKYLIQRHMDMQRIFVFRDTMSLFWKPSAVARIEQQYSKNLIQRKEFYENMITIFNLYDKTLTAFLLKQRQALQNQKIPEDDKITMKQKLAKIDHILEFYEEQHERSMILFQQRMKDEDDDEFNMNNNEKDKKNREVKQRQFLFQKELEEKFQIKLEAEQKVWNQTLEEQKKLDNLETRTIPQVLKQLEFLSSQFSYDYRRNDFLNPLNSIRKGLDKREEDNLERVRHQLVKMKSIVTPSVETSMSSQLLLVYRLFLISMTSNSKNVLLYAKDFVGTEYSQHMEKLIVYILHDRLLQRHIVNLWTRFFLLVLLDVDTRNQIFVSETTSNPTLQSISDIWEEKNLFRFSEWFIVCIYLGMSVTKDRDKQIIPSFHEDISKITTLRKLLSGLAYAYFKNLTEARRRVQTLLLLDNNATKELTLDKIGNISDDQKSFIQQQSSKDVQNISSSSEERQYITIGKKRKIQRSNNNMENSERRPTPQELNKLLFYNNETDFIPNITSSSIFPRIITKAILFLQILQTKNIYAWERWVNMSGPIEKGAPDPMVRSFKKSPNPFQLLQKLWALELKQIGKDIDQGYYDEYCNILGQK